MTTTYRKINEFLTVAAQWREKATGHEKFSYALKKVEKACKAHFEAYHEALSDLQIEHCSVDGAGNLMHEPNRDLVFSKDGLRKLNAAQRALWNTTPVSVDAFKVKGDLVPADLTPEQREAFDGFVLSESPALELVESNA